MDIIAQECKFRQAVVKNFKRTNASYLPKELFNKYKKYLKGMK